MDSSSSPVNGSRWRSWPTERMAFCCCHFQSSHWYWGTSAQVEWRRLTLGGSSSKVEEVGFTCPKEGGESGGSTAADIETLASDLWTDPARLRRSQAARRGWRCCRVHAAHRSLPSASSITNIDKYQFAMQHPQLAPCSCWPMRSRIAGVRWSSSSTPSRRVGPVAVPGDGARLVGLQLIDRVKVTYDTASPWKEK